jgi:hypothetical protein
MTFSLVLKSTLRQIVNYYNERGSYVYIASLDAAKAFDRVNHFKLFSALLKKVFHSGLLIL